jgi:hypothetical protein
VFGQYVHIDLVVIRHPPLVADPIVVGIKILTPMRLNLQFNLQLNLQLIFSIGGQENGQMPCIRL